MGSNPFQDAVDEAMRVKTKSADKKAETYTAPDGTQKTRMTPKEKDLIKDESVQIDEGKFKEMDIDRQEKEERTKRFMDAFNKRKKEVEKRKLQKRGMYSEEVEHIDEVLGKDAKIEDYIKDFVDSDAPQFEGKSKEKRIEMAKAAFYAAQKNEEVEQIDEISKKTLGSYIKKAAADAGKSGMMMGSQDRSTASKGATKYLKRYNGISKATDKLTKEDVEELDEISQDMKDRYKEKAGKQVKELTPWTKKGEYKDIAKRMVARRKAGIAKANEEVEEFEEGYRVHSTTHSGEKFKSKLFPTKKEADDHHWKRTQATDRFGKKTYKKIEVVKEEVELDEAFKRGHTVMMKDGESSSGKVVKVNKTDGTVKVKWRQTKTTTDVHHSKLHNLDEAGGFSYGMKPPRKGSVAWYAAQKRKEQEKNTKPVNPKDNMVGNAKVISNEDVDLNEDKTAHGKHVETHNGYPIHDLGNRAAKKEKRFLVYHQDYAFIHHTAPTLKAAKEKASSMKTVTKSKPLSKEDQANQDWRDEMKQKIKSGEVRRGVRGY